MSDDNDLIRRGDAIAAMNSVALTYGVTWEPHSVKLCKDAVRALPAVQDRFHPLIDVHLMVEANAKIQSIGDARAALAKIKGVEHE